MNDLTVVETIAEWQKLKALGFDSVTAPITRRVYNPEHMDWFRQAPRPGFTATVSAERISLEARGLGSSSIVFRMSAIFKPAVEATDGGLLAPGLTLVCIPHSVSTLWQRSPLGAENGSACASILNDDEVLRSQEEAYPGHQGSGGRF